MELFGYEINRKVSSQGEAKAEKIISPIPKANDEGSTTVTVGGGYYGQFVDLEGTDAVSDHQLIVKYREAAMQAECDAAVSDIVDGALASGDTSSPIELITEDLDQPDKVKKEIHKEYYNGKEIKMFS